MQIYWWEHYVHGKQMAGLKTKNNVQFFYTADMCGDVVGVMCMPMSSKFLTESTGEKIVNIGQYLAKIQTKDDSSLFFGPPCSPTYQ